MYVLLVGGFFSLGFFCFALGFVGWLVALVLGFILALFWK